MTSQKKFLRRAVLNNAGAARISSRRPWIFRGDLLQVPECERGDIVAISNKRGQVLGWGLWSDTQLCLRVLTYGPHEPDQMKLLRSRIERALELRRLWCPGEETFRWVHGEGDRLPGITADLYGDVLSLQLSIMGWYRHADEVARTFRKVRKLSAIILRSDTKYLEKEGIPLGVRILLGTSPQEPFAVRVGDVREYIDALSGQKTGAYLDVRRVPALLDPLYKGARVLDCFCYRGHFTLHAMLHGAESVTAIDQSQAALDGARDNIALNGLSSERVKFICGNAFDIMREIDASRERYDIVIMDPPPFAPSAARVSSARRGYKELAVRALRRLEPGGHLVFMSCSHAFTRDMLLETLSEAACDADKICRVVHEIHQPQDHPTLLGAPETDYLKGFVMGVEAN